MFSLCGESSFYIYSLILSLRWEDRPKRCFANAIFFCHRVLTHLVLKEHWNANHNWGGRYPQAVGPYAFLVHHGGGDRLVALCNYIGRWCRLSGDTKDSWTRSCCIVPQRSTGGGCSKTGHEWVFDSYVPEILVLGDDLYFCNIV